MFCVQDVLHCNISSPDCPSSWKPFGMVSLLSLSIEVALEFVICLSLCHQHHLLKSLPMDCHEIWEIFTLVCGAID